MNWIKRRIIWALSSDFFLLSLIGLFLFMALFAYQAKTSLYLLLTSLLCACRSYLWRNCKSGLRICLSVFAFFAYMIARNGLVIDDIQVFKVLPAVTIAKCMLIVAIGGVAFNCCSARSSASSRYFFAIILCFVCFFAMSLCFSFPCYYQNIIEIVSGCKFDNNFWKLFYKILLLKFNLLAIFAVYIVCRARHSLCGAAIFACVCFINVWVSSFTSGVAFLLAGAVAFAVFACRERRAAFNIIVFLFGIYFVLFPFLFFIESWSCMVIREGIFRTACERYFIWRHSSAVILESLPNCLFGVGADKSFALLRNAVLEGYNFCPDHPHNYSIQIWREGGLFGILFALRMIFSILRGIERSNDSILWVCIFVYCFICGQINLSIWQPWWISWVALCMALFALILKKDFVYNDAGTFNKPEP